ncbi:MAG: carboxymuconolactone decarboxylase family protein [Planctomycetes bacterium]|nr:carboxymuconolactone decarboxylase family protein [Planctomycetota bacterium]
MSKSVAHRLFFAALGLNALAVGSALAVDSDNAPRPVPLTRPEMKEFLEDMKGRTLRIPLPELTEADKEALGERGSSYESRLRYHYMQPGEGQGPGGQRRAAGGGAGGGGFGRDNDPDNTLDYAFKVQLFWIVSRTNNCQYCLGHQESKLLGAGMTEDEIAALDGDWSEHTPAQRTAYAFARKITYEPHHLNDADINGLRKFYMDKQILEMILSVAGNKSINRWKEGAGIPQSSGGGNFGRRPAGAETTTESPRPTPTSHSYLTPTSPRFQKSVTKVAPIVIDSKTGQPSGKTVANRPNLESRDDVELALQAARKRTPRLPLVDEDKTRELLPEGFPAGPLPQWVRLLANFPNSARARISSIRSAEDRNDLKPLFKAQVSWIIARQDRAWYAVGQARQRLLDQGWTDDQIYTLDGDWSAFTPAERSLFTLARKLSTTPVVLTDADVAEAVQQAGPRDVVQTISYTTNRASFDRITESAGLRLDQ